MANAFNFGRTGSDQTALFNKIYRGSVGMYPESGLFFMNGPNSNLIDSQTLVGAKSLQNLIFGDVPPPEEFTPGDEFIGQTIAQGEVVSVTDDYIVAGTFFKKDQMLQAQNASRLLSDAAFRHRQKIQLEFDKRIVIMAAKAARAAAVTKTEGSYVHQISPGGTRVTDGGNSGTYATALNNAYPLSSAGATAIREKLRELNYELDLKRLPAGPQYRGIIMHPRWRQVLSFDSTGQVFSKDYVIGNDQNRQEITVLDGFRVLGYALPITNRGPLPDRNIVADASTPSRYATDFSPQASSGAPVCLAFCSDGMHKAVQVLTADNLTSSVLWQENKLGWLAMSYIKAGANQLHDWCAGSIELTSAAS